MSDPLDVRLVPAALAAWVAAVVATRGAAGSGCAVVVGVLVVVLLLGVQALRRAGGGGRARGAPPAAARARHRAARPAGGGVGVALVALAAAGAVLASGAAQVAARERGPVRLAAQARAVVRVVAVVAEPARVVRSAWGDGQVRVRTSPQTLTWRGRTYAVRGTLEAVATSGALAAAPGARVELTGRLAPAPDGLAVLAVTRVEAVRPPRGVAGLVAGVRSRLVAACAGLGPQARGLVPSMAVGDTSALDPSLAQAMRVAGLTHLVAVSGQHVAIVLLVALALAGVARAPRWGRAAVAAAALAGFVALVGPSPSVARAAVMGGVAVLGVALGRPSRPVPALALAVVALLVQDPWAAGALGFQLSVASTAVIVLVVGPAHRALCARLGARHPARWARGAPAPRLLTLVLVPLAAQSATAPLVVLVNPTLAPWAVLANVLAAPAVVPLTVLGLLTALLGAWPAAATLVAHAAAVPAELVAAVARTCAALPGASTPWRPGVPGAVGLAALVLAAWWAGRLVVVPQRATRAPRPRQARRR